MLYWAAFANTKEKSKVLQKREHILITYMDVPEDLWLPGYPKNKLLTPAVDRLHEIILPRLRTWDVRKKVRRFIKSLSAVELDLELCVVDSDPQKNAAGETAVDSYVQKIIDTNFVIAGEYRFGKEVWEGNDTFSFKDESIAILPEKLVAESIADLKKKHRRAIADFLLAFYAEESGLSTIIEVLQSDDYHEGETLEFTQHCNVEQAFFDLRRLNKIHGLITEGEFGISPEVPFFYEKTIDPDAPVEIVPASRKKKKKDD